MAIPIVTNREDMSPRCSHEFRPRGSVGARHPDDSAFDLWPEESRPESAREESGAIYENVESMGKLTKTKKKVKKLSKKHGADFVIGVATGLMTNLITDGFKAAREETK